MSPRKRKRRRPWRLPQFRLRTLFFVVTVLAAVLALARVCGIALIGIPLGIVVGLLCATYILIYITAPLFVFTIVCLSSRLSFRHIPMVAAITLAGLLTVPFCIAVCSPVIWQGPLSLSSLIRDIAVWMAPAVLWWTGQIVLIGCVWFLYHRRKQRISLLQHAYPRELPLPTTSRETGADAG